MRGIGWDSSLQEGASHTYTLKLDYFRIKFLSCKKKKNKNKKSFAIDAFQVDLAKK